MGENPRFAVESYGPEASLGLAGQVWPCYQEAFGDWSDLVVAALPGQVTDEWVGGHFEFVELAVAQSSRCHGLGRRLHDALLDGVTGNCLLSTTDDPGDAAARLYRSRGWRLLGLLRPGTQVMGLHV